MERTFPRTLAVLTAALCASIGPAADGVRAQRPAAGGLLFTEFELGARGYIDRPATSELAQFQKFRDDPSGAILQDLRVWWRRDAQRVEFRARRAAQEDQSLAFRSTALGRYTFDLERDRVPRIFSTTGRLLGDQLARGEFLLATPRPHPIEHNTGARLERTGVRWDTDRLALSIHPRPNAPLRAEYTRTSKSGDRPMGMVFGSAGGNFREILEPVEHTAHAFRLSQDFATPVVQVAVAYHFSRFENKVEAVTADNPLVSDPSAAGAYRGQTALAPSNRAHALSASAGVSLPFRSRINGSVAYGWRSQDQSFLPHTINGRLLSGDLPVLPESLGGDTRTLRIGVSARTRPVASVTASARYRLFELEDRTPDLVLGSRVRSDQAVLSGPFEAHRYPYTRENVGLDLGWSPVRPVTLRAEYDWERWERDASVRNVGETRERTPRLTLDVKPIRWVSLRGSYLWSERRGDEYEERNDLVLLRRFDQADRDREALGISVQVFPLDAMDLFLGYDRGERTYPDSPYGRQDDGDESWTAYLTWSPTPRVTAHASYVLEEFRLTQRSRYRGELPVEPDNPTFDWIGDTDESVRTVGFGATVGLLPRKLDVQVAWDRSKGISRLTTANPVRPRSSNVGNRTSAEAEDFPEVSHVLNPAHVALRYRVSDTWLATVRFVSERFTNEDFRTAGQLPSAGMDLLLGNDLRGYTARYMTVTVSYQPWIPGIRRPPV